jgi:plasmid maintenance system killer protein
MLVAIKGFRHKGLEQFFATGTKRGIQNAERVDYEDYH